MINRYSGHLRSPCATPTWTNRSSRYLSTRGMSSPFERSVSSAERPKNTLPLQNTLSSKAVALENPALLLLVPTLLQEELQTSHTPFEAQTLSSILRIALQFRSFAFSLCSSFFSHKRSRKEPGLHGNVLIAMIQKDWHLTSGVING